MRATRGRGRSVRPLPSSVRLGRPAPYDRDVVLARWRGGCCYCDAPATELDHVRPLARGGLDVESNVVGVCAADNHAKGDMPLWAWATVPQTQNLDDSANGRRGETR